MPHIRRAGALSAGTLALFLAACGQSPAGSDHGVATLRSAAATADASPSSADQRPLIRPDMSDAEIVAVTNAWSQCLADHGVPVMTPSDPNAIRKPRVDTSLPQYRSAVQACAAKQPEDWRDVEARTDPQYADRQRAELQCFTDKGVKAELRGDPPQITFTDDRQVGHGLDVAPECERKAFGDVMKKFNGQ